MFKFDNRLLFLIMVLGLLAVIIGCSQTDDIAAPKSITKVWLTAERLPPPVPGMAYELWVADTTVPDIDATSDVRSLGQFSYINSDTLVAFLEPDGSLRADSGLFQMDADLFDYSYLLVTIEDTTVASTIPGPAMLVQSITGMTDTLRLYFPQHDSLYDAIVRCNFETPTDGIRGDSTDWFYLDGYGLWFSSYQAITDSIHDTLGVTIDYVDSIIQPIIGPEGDTLNLPTLYAEYPDSVWAEFDTIMVDFGRDTLPLGVGIDLANPDDSVRFHYGATQHIIYKDTGDIPEAEWIPRTIKNYAIVWDTTVNSVELDVFTQDMYALPDLTGYGWHYKGWVVSDGIDPAALGKFSPPAWDYKTNELIIPGWDGGLLTTGTFSNVEEADDSNPFTLEIEWEVDSGSFIDTVLKRPALPGEDFLDGIALAAATNGVYSSPVNLFAHPNMSIFVTIEPLNMVTDTTNFPLLAFGWGSPGVPDTSQWTLINWTGTATGANGFPKITAEIERL